MKEKLINFLKSYYYVFLMILPFLFMDASVRIAGISINYFRAAMAIPGIIFVVIWIGLFVALALYLKRVYAVLLYSIFFWLFFVFFYANCIYFGLTGYYISFNLVFMASEGSSYILSTIVESNPLIHLSAVAAIALWVIAIIKMPKRERGDWKKALITVAVFLLIHTINPFLLGKANSELEWDTWRNPRNVYENFNDSNKNMKICGLYEYTVRDFYVTFLRPEEPEDPVEIEYLEEDYGETVHKSNSFTGIFEGRNVIFLQLEGIDNWLLNKEDMPNLYSLMENSIILNNHFSYYNGGGSTFNSELAVNTGFITPVSYIKNAYTLNTNLFPYSMPKMFKKREYAVNAFHMNTEEYYSRGINYENWGYDNYYGLIDENEYSDASYMLDRELIENEGFYDRLFHQEGSFVHYIITYTPHTPFTADSEVGEYLLGLENKEAADMTEEECARMFASETDYMVKLLLQGLKDNGLYDNTVLVIYSDHYLYTLSDKTALEKYKITENNLINRTPFFIWSSDLNEIIEKPLSESGIEYTKYTDYHGEINGVIGSEIREDAGTENGSGNENNAGTGNGADKGNVIQGEKEQTSEDGLEDPHGTALPKNVATAGDSDGSTGEGDSDKTDTEKYENSEPCGIVIDKVNSQIDILPTVLNMFGFSYIDEHYIGKDIFASDYAGYAFFSDYSWYNGDVYADGTQNIQISDNKMSSQDIEKMNKTVNEAIKKNDLMLKYDYFRRKQENPNDTAVE